MTHPSSTGITDWAELMLKDHGVLRLAWHNLHQIDAQMWRSNQPTPGRVEQAAKAGIKTIINLRGSRNDGCWKLEAEACKKANITLIDFTARSRAAPDKEMLYGARDLFNSIEKAGLDALQIRGRQSRADGRALCAYPLQKARCRGDETAFFTLSACPSGQNRYAGQLF